MKRLISVTNLPNLFFRPGGNIKTDLKVQKEWIGRGYVIPLTVF
jgi:hypothetical protein